MTEKKSDLPERSRRLSELDPFAGWFSSPLHLSRLFNESGQQGGLQSWSPSVDVSESDAGYAITVELAGARKEDVDIECHDGVLTIKGHKKSEREEQDEHRHFVERQYGSFSRSFRLPDDALADDVKATLKDGVLTVEIPRAEETKPRTIRIV